MTASKPCCRGLGHGYKRIREDRRGQRRLSSRELAWPFQRRGRDNQKLRRGAASKSWGFVRMTMVISCTHQACMAVITAAVPQERFRQVSAEQATTSSRRTAASVLKGVGCPRHPGDCVQACIIHACARCAFDVIAISAPAVRRSLLVSAGRSRAK